MDRLDFTALCNIASFLDQDDFLSFVLTCRALSECRHGVRTLAHVLANTRGLIDSRALDFGSLFIRFFAQKCVKDFAFLGFSAIYLATFDNNNRALKALKPLLTAPSAIEAILVKCSRHIPFFIAAIKHLDIPDEIRRPIECAVDSDATGFSLPSGTFFDKFGPATCDYYRFEIRDTVPKVIKRFGLLALTILFDGAPSTKDRFVARMESKTAAGFYKLANVERATVVVDTLSLYTEEYYASYDVIEPMCLCESIRTTRDRLGAYVRRMLALIPRPLERQQKLDMMYLLQQCGDYEMLKEFYSGHGDEIPFMIGHQDDVGCDWTDAEKAAQDELFLWALQNWPIRTKDQICHDQLIRRIMACPDRREIDQALAIINTQRTQEASGAQSESTPTILIGLSNLCSRRLIHDHELICDLTDAIFKEKFECAHPEFLISRIGHHGLYELECFSVEDRFRFAIQSLNCTAMKLCYAYGVSRPDLRLDREQVGQAFSDLLEIRFGLRNGDLKRKKVDQMLRLFSEQWPATAIYRHGMSIKSARENGDKQLINQLDDIFQLFSLDKLFNATGTSAVL